MYYAIQYEMCNVHIIVCDDRYLNGIGNYMVYEFQYDQTGCPFWF